MRISRESLTALTVLVAMLALAACDQKSKDDDEEDDPSTISGNGGGGGNGSTSLNVATTQVSTNIGYVESGMVPGSLSDESASLLDGGPCAGLQFFECQPRLLRLYLGLGKAAVKGVNRHVEQVGAGLLEHVGLPSDGLEQCGSRTNPDAEADIQKVEYCVTTASKFSVSMYHGEDLFMALSVDGGTYELTLEPAKGPYADQATSGKIHSIVNYTDEDTYGVEVEMSGMPCKDEDVRGPQKIAIRLERDGDLRQGKAMLYHPLWLFGDDDGVTCATESSDALALAYYTDFIGNDNASTASIFFMPRTVDDLSNIGDWEVSDFCDNFPDHCSGGMAFGDPNPIATTYSNPFCVQDRTASYGGACAVGVEAIDTPTYGAAEKWILPSVLKDL